MKEFVDENNKILPATAAIYKMLSEKIGMTPKTIHVAVTKHTNDVFGSEFDKTKNRIEKVSDSDEDFDLFSTDGSGFSYLSVSSRFRCVYALLIAQSCPM